MLLFSFIIVFHGLAILGVVPYEMLWGGKLKDEGQMLVFETVSIWLNLLMLGIVAIEGKLWKMRVNPRLIKIVLWIMSALFLVNTMGNLFSKNVLEKIIFTPLTLLLFVLCLRLATHKAPLAVEK